MNIEIDKIINEFGIEIAIENIAKYMSLVIKKYKETNNENYKQIFLQLLKERDKIYMADKEVIKKYLNYKGDI